MIESWTMKNAKIERKSEEQEVNHLLIKCQGNIDDHTLINYGNIINTRYVIWELPIEVK